MNNSNGVPQIKFSLPNVNLVKVVMTINLWIFLFIQFFVLVPVTAYAAPSADVITITQGDMVYKDIDTYTTKIIVKNSSASAVNAIAQCQWVLVPNLRYQVSFALHF